MVRGIGMYIFGMIGGINGVVDVRFLVVLFEEIK